MTGDAPTPSEARSHGPVEAPRESFQTLPAILQSVCPQTWCCPGTFLNVGCGCEQSHLPTPDPVTISPFFLKALEPRPTQRRPDKAQQAGLRVSLLTGRGC